MSSLPFPHVDGVTHRYVDAGGLRVHLAEAGPEDGEPILLLHGWPQHWYEWRGPLSGLSGGYRRPMSGRPGGRGGGGTREGGGKETGVRGPIATLGGGGTARG